MFASLHRSSGVRGSYICSSCLCKCLQPPSCNSSLSPSDSHIRIPSKSFSTTSTRREPRIGQNNDGAEYAIGSDGAQPLTTRLRREGFRTRRQVLRRRSMVTATTRKISTDNQTLKALRLALLADENSGAAASPETSNDVQKTESIPRGKEKRKHKALKREDEAESDTKATAGNSVTASGEEAPKNISAVGAHGKSTILKEPHAAGEQEHLVKEKAAAKASISKEPKFKKDSKSSAKPKSSGILSHEEQQQPIAKPKAAQKLKNEGDPDVAAKEVENIPGEEGTVGDAEGMRTGRKKSIKQKRNERRQRRLVQKLETQEPKPSSDTADPNSPLVFRRIISEYIPETPHDSTINESLDSLIEKGNLSLGQKYEVLKALRVGIARSRQDSGSERKSPTIRLVKVAPPRPRVRPPLRVRRLTQKKKIVSKPSRKPSQDTSTKPFPPRFIDIKTLDADTLQLTPIDEKALNVPTLSYGLERVLFNPGVYHLQDPRSRVFNFDPYLQTIMPVNEFDFDALKEYITSSQDHTLINKTVEEKKKYSGSTSSMTSVLSHFHYLISQWRPINTGTLSQMFPVEYDTFTTLQRAPVSIFLRWRDGVYAIDADKEFDTQNILMMLGKSMEKLLTLPMEDFEKYRKENSNQISKEDRESPEEFHYTKMGDFLMRSQLDAHDPRLPGTGMFDLKTRAVVSVRMDAQQYESTRGYEIRGRHGEWESFEREYYDMIRAAFLKYSLQVRMGRMDGIFVAFHNTERIFGFQYISISEMDYAIHGTENTTLGDSEFKLSLGMLNTILDRATAKFPEQSLRIQFETRGSNASAPYMYIFAEPISEDKIEEIQQGNKAKVEEFERNISGKTSERIKQEERKAQWDSLEAQIGESMEKDEFDEPENMTTSEENEAQANAESNASLTVEDAHEEREEDALIDDHDIEERSEGENEIIEDESYDERQHGEDRAPNNQSPVEEPKLETVAPLEASNVKAEPLEPSSINLEDVARPANPAEDLKDGVADLENSHHDNVVGLSEATAVPLEHSKEHGGDQSHTPSLGSLGSDHHTEGILTSQEAVTDESKIESDQSGAQLKESNYGESREPEVIYEDFGSETQNDTEALTLTPRDENSIKQAMQTPEGTKRTKASRPKKEPVDQRWRDMLAMTIAIRNKVNGKYVERPRSLESSDKWEVEYAFYDIDEDSVESRYNAMINRRQKSRQRGSDKKVDTWNDRYIEKLRKLSQKGRAWRTRQNEIESKMPVKVLEVKDSKKKGGES